MTLTNRLLFFFLSALAAVLLGFSAALYLLANQYLYLQVDERLDTVVNTLSAAIESGSDHVEWEPKGRHIKLDFFAAGEQIEWIVADSQGQILGQSHGKGLDLFLADTSPMLQLTESKIERDLKWQGQTWKAEQRWIHAENDEGEPRERKITRVKQSENELEAISITGGISLVPVRTMLGRLAISLVAISMGIWLVAFLAGRQFCRQAILPLTQMALATSQIDASDFSNRLPAVATKDEIEQLNLAINSLLERLQVTYERQRSFTSDASHQLRTPLTAILGQMEVALRRDRTTDEYKQVLTVVQERSKHLAQMVESLLFLARADSESQLPNLEQIDLSSWLPAHLATWSDHPRFKDLNVECDNLSAHMICAQPALLSELLNTLIDNALKFSPAGSSIMIKASRTAEAVSLSVEDHGMGMAPDDVANLFLPFFRSRDVRNRGIEGSGLGLSIAKRLAEVFSGALIVKTTPGLGSCFTLTLPSLASAHPATSAVENY